MSDAMTALDTRRQQAREARRALESATPGEDFINATDALLAAHRALVVAELAGETDAETLEKAVDAAAHSVTGDGDSYREVVGIELRAAAPHIRAPLAAKLVEAEMERLRKMDEDNQFGYVALRLKLDAAEARVASLEAALKEIVDAKPGDWTDFERDDRLNQYLLWSKNRARFALGGPV